MFFKNPDIVYISDCHILFLISIIFVDKHYSSCTKFQSSLPTEGASSAGVIDGPGKKKARTSGNDNGTAIGAAVGGAVVFVIFVILIIIFCKRRKFR